jgi:hypothetical protein
MVSVALEVRPQRVSAAGRTVDITPPVGIHTHNWSYSSTPQARTIHRPLEAKILAIAEQDGAHPSLLVALDLGWWMSSADEKSLRDGILLRTALAQPQLILALTHTHSGPSIARSDADRAGGHLIGGYLDRIGEDVAAGAEEALGRLAPCTLDWTVANCDLAVNRDLYLAEEERYVVGANPAGQADDTLVVGRVSAVDGTVIATVANYAVHPTTLGGANSAISPDLVGAARELVEAHGGGMFLFLQGASGDLSPREQYASDLGLADKNGRTLGYAVLSALSNMLEPGARLEYAGTIESGAPLGTFATRDAAEATPIAHVRIDLLLPTQDNAPPETDDETVRADRALRATRVRTNVAAGTANFPVTVWDIGDVVVFAYPGEAYSVLQRQLRSEFPAKVILFLNLANGAHMGYLAPETAYDEGRYPAWQSPLARGCLELLIDACRRELVARSRPTSTATSSITPIPASTEDRKPA